MPFTVNGIKFKTTLDSSINDDGLTNMIRMGTSYQGIMSMQYKHPNNPGPLLYRKTWICRGIPIFLIFAPNIDFGYS